MTTDDDHHLDSMFAEPTYHNPCTTLICSQVANCSHVLRPSTLPICDHLQSQMEGEGLGSLTKWSGHSWHWSLVQQLIHILIYSYKEAREIKQVPEKRPVKHI